MSTPHDDVPRLLDDEAAPDLLREALRAGRDDLPQGPALERLWQRVVVPPSGGPPGTDGAGGGGGATAGGAGGGVGASAGVGAAAVKIVAAVGAAALAASVAWQALRRDEPTPSASTAAVVSAPVPSASSSAPFAEPAPPTSAAPSAPPRPSAAPSSAASAAPSARTAASAASAEPSSSASEPPPTELDLVQRARSALAGDPAKALALTTEAARLYPSGMLTQEREVIRIQALAGTGQRAQAVAEARAFRARHPNSVYTPRLEALFPELGPAP